MGADSPGPVVTPVIHERVRREVMWPTVRSLAEGGTPCVGFLYAGLMITRDGTPRVLEFNWRVVDPQTHTIPMRLRSALPEVGDAAVDGRLHLVDVDGVPRAAVGVVLAAGGYPDTVRKGEAI